MALDTTNRPDFQTDAHKSMMAETRIMRDVSAGISTVRDRGVEYLPRHANEDHHDYQNRLKQAVLFNAVQRTRDGLVGMVFRRDPVLSEDINAQVRTHLENIDNAGTHVDVFAKRVFEDAIESGHTGILVEFPKVQQPEGRTLTTAEEMQIGARPYWVHYRKEDIYPPRVSQINGRTVVTQLVLRETTEEDVGEFGTEQVERFRVLNRVITGARPVVVWRLLRYDEDKDVVVREDGGVVANQEEIPFVVVYGEKTGVLMSKPPLLDLAEINLAHYRLLSDHIYAMHLANIPIGVLSGVDPDVEIKVGPNSWLKLPVDGTFKWEAHGGENFSENREQLKEFKADMAALGLSMLQVETRRAETEESQRMNKAEQDSALATAARSLQDALEQALVFHGNFMRIKNPGTISINRDFENRPMTPDERRSLSEQVAAGQLALETMWAIQRGRGDLPDDFDPEVEMDRIASSMPAPSFPSSFEDLVA